MEFCDPLARLCYLRLQEEAKDKLEKNLLDNRASAVDNEETKMGTNSYAQMKREQADSEDEESLIVNSKVNIREKLSIQYKEQAN